MKNIIVLFTFLFLTSSLHAQDGLYLRLQYWGSNLDIQWLYFQDTVLVRNPQFGILPLQLEKEIISKDENVAKIQQTSNTKISLKWGNGVYEAVNIALDNNQLIKFNGGECTKAKPVTQQLFENKRYSALVNFNNLSKDISLFFGKDGAFNIETKTPEGHINKEVGTYSISGNLITFKLSNGKEQKSLIHHFNSDTEDLIIDQQLFKQIK